MKKILIAMAMMSAMAMAQTSTGSSDQNQGSSAPAASSSQSSTSTDQSAQAPDKSKDTSAMPQSDKGEKAAGKEKSVKGCLHKDGDNYWLATKSTKYHVMSSQDLSAHDGHEVKVTGTASEGPMPASTDNKKVHHLEATNVEMVADTCSGAKSKDTSSTPK